MLLIYRSFILRNAFKPCVFPTYQKKAIHFTVPLQIKEIVVTKENNVTVVEGKSIQSPRENLLVKYENQDKGVCPLCALNLNLKHTDVLILSQFLRTDGCMLPRAVTKLCKRQQNIVVNLVAMAQKAGLMPNLAPISSKGDPQNRYGAKKLRRYYDETTIDGYSSKYSYKPYKLNLLFGKPKDSYGKGQAIRYMEDDERTTKTYKIQGQKSKQTLTYSTSQGHTLYH